MNELKSPVAFHEGFIFVNTEDESGTILGSFRPIQNGVEFVTMGKDSEGKFKCDSEILAVSTIEEAREILLDNWDFYNDKYNLTK